jgi:hypothetical protein
VQGAQGMIHTVALLKAEVSVLRQAIEILSKRRRAKTHGYVRDDP